MDDALRQQILHMVEENERAIQRSREKDEFLDRILRDYEQRADRARRKLRAAGILK